MWADGPDYHLGSDWPCGSKSRHAVKTNKLPEMYGYQPRSQEEADDLEAEAEYWRNYKGKGNCLLVLLTLVLTPALIGWALWL